MKGLDLRNFQKISEDDKVAKFKHPDGHEITVAKHGISPKLKKELSAIPAKMASGGKVRKYAEGGGDSSPESQAEDAANQAQGQQPVNININASPQPQQTSSPVDTADSLAQEGQAAPVRPDYQKFLAMEQQSPSSFVSPEQRATQDMNLSDQYKSGDTADMNQFDLARAKDLSSVAGQDPNRAPSADPSAQQPNQGFTPDQVDQASGSQPQNDGSPQAQDQSQPQQQSSPVQQYQQVKDQEMQEMSAEDKAWVQDLSNQHITPETYGDLFAKKDTLGKIGMIFGMMLGTGGAGMAHQQSAALAAMNQEINNDLAAQQQSKQNAQNFLRLSQQNELNKAQAANLKIDTDSKAYALAKMRMNQAAFHAMTQQVQKLPLGSPQRQQAEQTLALMNNGVQNDNFNIMDRAAAASAYSKVLFSGNQQQQGASPAQGFQQQNRSLRMLGEQGQKVADYNEEHHFPGVAGQSSIKLTPEDRDSINSGIAFDQKLNRFTQWTQAHSGDLSPSDMKTGQTLAAELQGAYRQATHGGVYKEGEQNFISKVITDNPTAFFNKVRVLPQLKALSQENQARVDQLVKSKGFSGYQGTAASQPQYKVYNGVKYMRGPNGEAVPVQ